MRGIFCFIFLQRIDTRFNPAYAGNITDWKLRRFRTEVQPRVCGEYVVKVIGECIGTGSTPRMRGIYRHYSLFGNNHRFNPAYAGNIILLLVIRLIQQVQPRVCGEYHCSDTIKVLISGSTPRMRGI